MLYPDLEEIIKTIIEKEVKVVFTSAGNPKIDTSKLKGKGIIVVHVEQHYILVKSLKSNDLKRLFC